MTQQNRSPINVHDRFETLHMLKGKGTGHIQNKKFAWAVVYLSDALQEIDKTILQIEDQHEMESLIKEIKIPCHKNLSLCHLKQGNSQGCIDQCQEVLEVEPNCVKILYRMSQAQINLKKVEEAELSLRKAFLIDPNEKEVMKALEKIEIIKQQKSRRQQNGCEGSTDAGGLSLTRVLNVAKFMSMLPFLIFLYIWGILSRAITFRK